MGRLDHAVPPAVDERASPLRGRAPENVYKVFARVGEIPDDGVGECLPAVPLVRGGAVRLHCERRVQQQDPLVRPRKQVGNSPAAGVSLRTVGTITG